MRVGSLFSGIGGFDLGLERAGYDIVWQVENNDYCRKVLQKHWPSVPCHHDITTIDWDYISRVDLVCGGFPCQPFSCAGKKKGKDDDRYLWPEVVRCVAALRPTWLLLENVAGFATMAQFTVSPPVESEGSAQGEVGDVFHRVGRGMADEAMETLEGLGYEVQPFIIPACAVNAPHRRDRLWIVAHHHGTGGERRGKERIRDLGAEPNSEAERCTPNTEIARPGEALADPESDDQWGKWQASRRQQIETGRRSPQPEAPVAHPERESERTGLCADQSTRQRRRRSGDCGGTDGPWWPAEPNVGRVAHGVPGRVERLRGLGNAIVPQIAEELGRMILTVMQEDTSA